MAGTSYEHMNPLSQTGMAETVVKRHFFFTPDYSKTLPLPVAEHLATIPALYHLSVISSHAPFTQQAICHRQPGMAPDLLIIRYMKIHIEDTAFWWFAVVALAVCSLINTGCENNDTFDSIASRGTPAAMTISPREVYLSPTNNVSIFTASGGIEPYSWRVSDATLGTIPETTADTITYTREASKQGGNLLIVTDQNNWEAQATINQE